MFLQPQLKHHSTLTKELICISYVPFIHSLDLCRLASPQETYSGALNAILTLKLVWLSCQKLLQIELKSS